MKAPPVSHDNISFFQIDASCTYHACDAIHNVRFPFGMVGSHEWMALALNAGLIVLVTAVNTVVIGSPYLHPRIYTYTILCYLHTFTPFMSVVSDVPNHSHHLNQLCTTFGGSKNGE